ncbi:DEKNAAC103160 [Brettanomyces naardenensis]|uniref:DEKNAAC103160 n=1 Tax=Brettanomyces naardenensis TaxID=13370 RepID=A0A448YMG3_BRENA|nr:DEKNAAC103160 [Brettanomyces naardenensis]
MFRDRTNLYIAYRRTFPHPLTDRFDRASEEEQGLIHNEESGETYRPYKDSDTPLFDVEMAQLPPSMVKLEEDSEAMLNGVGNDITELGKLYRKNMLPGFTDTSEDEAKINEMSMKITHKFQFMYTEIRKLNDEKLRFKTKSETLLVENLKKKLALRTQELSTSFRRLQNNYIRYLREDEFDEVDKLDKSDGKIESSEDSTIESYSREALKSSSKQLRQVQQQDTLNDTYLEQREREIYKIAQGVVEISTIFKELETMVIDQGTVLDRIDYNLSKTVEDVKKADKQMTKAEGYQKATTKCKVVFFLVLLILLLLMVLMIKPMGGGGGSKQKNQTTDESSL